jgi:hypothetical protein
LEFGYTENGKHKVRKIPRNNKVLPKTKRLRKKRLWLKCGDCNKWFTRYSQTHGTRNDGKKVCHVCLKKRLEVIKQKLN